MGRLRDVVQRSVPSMTRRERDLIRATWLSATGVQAITDASAIANVWPRAVASVADVYEPRVLLEVQCAHTHLFPSFLSDRSTDKHYNY